MAVTLSKKSSIITLSKSATSFQSA